MVPRSPQAPDWLDYKEEDMTEDEARADFRARMVQVERQRLADAQKRITRYFDAPPGIWITLQGPTLADDIKLVGPDFMRQFTHPSVHAPAKVSTMEGVREWVRNLFLEG